MSSMRIGFLCSTLLLTLSPLSAACQQSGNKTPASQNASIDYSQPVPTIKVTSRLVVLDVVVSDGNGTPVTGLKPTDFTLYEDGVPQKITGLTEYNTANQPAAPARDLPPNTFSVQPPLPKQSAMTAIVISANGAQFFSVLDQLRSYLKNSTPQTPIAIFRMDWQGMHLVQSFTSDHKVLLDAAYSKRIEPPLGFQVGGYTQPGESATHILARYLSNFPGRINVLWFSAGDINSDMEREFPDVSSFARDLRQTAEVTRLNPIALYFADANGVAAPVTKWFSFDESVDEIAYELGYPSILGNGLEDNRNNLMSMENELIKLKTDSVLMDTSSPFSSGASVCTHFIVADATGGAAFCNTNGFKEVISKVVSTGSHYYTISYQPTNPNWDGSYRNISVKVKGLDKIQPPEPTAWQQITGFGTVQQPKLEYRHGYFARTTPPAIPQPTTAVPASSAFASSGAPKDATHTSARKMLTTSANSDTGLNADELHRTMAFGSPTPDAMQFTVVLNAPKQKEKVGRSDILPPDNYLTGPFRDKPFRNFHVHYWVDPAGLHFVREANGLYRDNLRFVVMVYRDDGLTANSLSTRWHIEVTGENLENVLATGVTLDQTIAIPVDGHYFIRAGLQDAETGRTGAVEVPSEEIRLSPGSSLAENQPPLSR